MPTIHVLTVAPDLPASLLDRVLSAAEEGLCSWGASRVWIDPCRPAFAVMADFPAVTVVATCDPPGATDP